MSLNVSFCINSLERSLATIVQQQATIISEQKLQREQLERFKSDINEQLSRIKSRQDMIKTRQEMIFTKQDQIQYTLHGETRAFQSPPLHSALPMTSPPMTSPFGSLVGSECFAKPIPHTCTSSIADASDFSSVVDEYDSLFNFDWLTQEEKTLHKTCYSLVTAVSQRKICCSRPHNTRYRQISP